MASLAGIFKSMGFEVQGSDQNVYPPMSTQLEKLKIKVNEGYKAQNLIPPPDFVVVGNVISKNNPEAQALLESSIPYSSLPKALGEYVIENRKTIIVAGTHGKTTTTSMAAVVALEQDLKPGFLIGGIPLNFSTSFQKPEGDWFVIEGDEYDTAFFDKVPKFLHYRPLHVILTSIEFDHADIYRDLDHVKESFRKLLRLIPEDGTLIYNAEDKNILSLLGETRCKNVFGYGESTGDFTVADRQNLLGRNQFAVIQNNERIADIAIKSFGIHNTLNALSVFALSTVLQWNLSKTLTALSKFKGVKRRQEILFEIGGITVVEDFAHHPTAVDLTLKSIHEQFPNRRVIGVFEPRSATSRRNIFQEAYAKAFAAADLVFLMEPFDQSQIPEEQRFSSKKLKADLEKQNTEVFLHQSVDELVVNLTDQTKKGDVILVMSNGGFDGIYQKLNESLKRSSHSHSGQENSQ